VGIPPMTDDDVADLKKALPKCTVSWDIRHQQP
jgi:hypothetical protein